MFHRDKIIAIKKRQVQEFVDRLTKDMPNDLYLEVLEEIETDIKAMIDCKKEVRGLK